MTSIFTRIINREAPGEIFYETDEVFVIADRYPRDAVHLLIIPRKEYRTFYETPPEVLEMLNRTAKTLAEKLKIRDHFRIIINNGYGQEIFHVHYHFLSNRGRDNLKLLKA
jgi:histidine triad (HIT) family protein